MPRYTLQAFGKLHSPELILLLTAPMKAAEKKDIEAGGASVQRLAGFSGAEAPDEDFFVYKVVRKAISG
jgi:hypothetical protein